MVIPLRWERSMSQVEQALDWWVTLTGEEKGRWLQCEEAPEVIEQMLRSPLLGVRDLARFGAVGDAWNAFREQTLTVLDFNDVIRAGGGDPPPSRPRERYEREAARWDQAGRRPEHLETDTRCLVALRVWFNSPGCRRDFSTTPPSETLLAYHQACLHARRDVDPTWYEVALRGRSECVVCDERYLLENLTLCTHCLGAYCYRCVPESPKAANGNVAHRCGGELVG